MAEIDGHQLVADPRYEKPKHALLGTVLRPGDSVRDAVVERSVSRGRNPVVYLDTFDVEAMSTAQRAGGVRSHTPCAFLVTNNPALWEWEDQDFASKMAQKDDGHIVRGTWSTGGRTSGIEPVGRAFLLRQGRGFRGIIGSVHQPHLPR